eukprot:795341-Prorocentrum_minimum.AAC.1
MDKSKELVRCTRSLLLGILGVDNVGNTAFWTFVPLAYCCTTHLEVASAAGAAVRGPLQAAERGPSQA